MNNETPQITNGYYSVPYTQGGPYEIAFNQFGNDFGRFLVAAGSVTFGGTELAQAVNSGMGGVGDLVVSVLGDFGRALDNRPILPTILHNIETAVREFEDSRMWMSPNLAD